LKVLHILSICWGRDEIDFQREKRMSIESDKNDKIRWRGWLIYERRMRIQALCSSSIHIHNLRRLGAGQRAYGGDRKKRIPSPSSKHRCT
jgi:hypothetical protein